MVSLPTWLSDAWLGVAATRASRRFDSLQGELPRVALVKQDCNEDLYCCPPDRPALETLQSTLLRSGPAALLTRFNARFLLLKTEPDPECNIWKEKWDPLRWCPIEWFESFRDHVPGRDHGQSRYAQAADDIDWSQFDIVISSDVAIPARVTRKFPTVTFAYYVREMKAPSFTSSFAAPIVGQDLYLSQLVDLYPARTEAHVVHFPYHFQYFGIYHELLKMPMAAERQGIFVDYHTARAASNTELAALAEFGPVYAKTAADDVIDATTGDRIPLRSMEADGLRALTRSKYHVKWGGRVVYGTGKFEAIAAGCLTLSNPDLDRTGHFQSPILDARDFDSVLRCLRRLESDPSAYWAEVARQRQMMDFLSFHRPALALIDAWRLRLRQRQTRSVAKS